MLHTILHGEPTDRPPLVIAHGLFGSGRNWGVIAKRLSDERQVIAVDMRNHGQSPWSDSHSYTDLAADLAEVIDYHGGHADVVGHSMGGKASMILALQHGSLIRRLIVADIAPVAYTHTQQDNIDKMKAVDLSSVTRRSEAEAQLAAQGVDRQLQSFFTQSLDIAGQRWRLNLEALTREMENIIGFPQVSGQWDGPTLFLTGAESDYVRPEHRELIRGPVPQSAVRQDPRCGPLAACGKAA